MYDVLDIARYIINRTIELGGTITNLKLQKVLFFIQYDVLKYTGGKCFEEDFIKNDYGAFQEDVYYEFRGNGSLDLDYQKTYLTIYYDKEKENISYKYVEIKPNIISEKIRRIIDITIKRYIDCHVFHMVNINQEHYLVRQVKKGDVISFDRLINIKN